MEMRDALTRVATVVDHDAIAAFKHAQFRRDLAGREQHRTEQFRMLRTRVCETRDALPGHDENMDRSLGMNVMKGDKLIRLVNDICGDFASGDFFKNGHAMWRKSSCTESAPVPQSTPAVWFLANVTISARSSSEPLLQCLR